MNVHKIMKQYACIILNVKDKRQVSTVTLFCNLGWLPIACSHTVFCCDSYAGSVHHDRNQIQGYFKAISRLRKENFKAI